MLNYLSGEFFRIRKSNLIKGLLIAGIFFPALFAFVLVPSLTQVEKTIVHSSFLYDISSLFVFSANIISSIILLVYKNKEEMRILLSQGRSKREIVVYDYISFQLLLTLLALFMATICIFINFLMAKYYSYDYTDGLKVFVDRFVMMLIIQYISNSYFYFFSYLADNSVFGYVFVIIFSLFAPVFVLEFLKKRLPYVVFILIGHILPLSGILSFEYVFEFKNIYYLLISFFLTALVSVKLSYYFCKKREY